MRKMACGATCSCCGKKISFLTIDKSVWSYKVRYFDWPVEYQCSYPCWRKESKRIRDERQKRNNQG